MRATKTMHVDAEPERDLSFLIDQSVNPPGTTMETVYESPDVEGNSYAWTFKMFGMPRKGVTVVTDYVPGEQMTFRSFGAFEGTSTWTVEPEEGGSKLTAQMDSRFAVPLIGRFLDPLVRREWEKNLAFGKRELERQLKDE